MTKLDQQAKDLRIQRQRERLADLEARRFECQMQLDEILEQTGGEVTPAADAIFQKLMEYDERIADKLDGYAYVVKSMEADLDRITERAMVLAERAMVLDGTIKRIKEAAKDYIERNVELDEKGRRRVVGDMHTIWVQGAGGPRPLEIDERLNPEDAHPSFQKKTIEWNTAAIREMLTEGQELTFAKLGDRTTVLRIK